MSRLPFDPPGDRPLDGHSVVFTGKLSSLRRTEATALVTRLGGTPSDEVTTQTTLLVVGSTGTETAGASREGRSDWNRSATVERAEALNAENEGQIRIIGEDEFFALAGLPSPDALKQQFYALGDLLERYPALRESHLRDLHTYRLVHPVARAGAETYVGFRDLLVIRHASAELGRGVPFRIILRSLLASRDGQLAFDFQLDTRPAKILRLPATRPAPPVERGSEVAAHSSTSPLSMLAEECFVKASALDTGGESTQDLAAAAYRKALEIDPSLVPALINLGNIHYAQDEMAEAQALYERAVSLEPDCFEGQFNLGNVHHDLGRYRNAERCYRSALALNPQHADAHLYLAITLEKTGRSEDARPHWRAYQRIAPDGKWVELAKEFGQL